MTYQASERIDRALPNANASRRNDGVAAPLPASAAPEDSAIDVASLLELFDGSAQAVARLLEVAALSIEQDLERIEAAARVGDGAVVTQAAHRLKGTSGSITAKRVSEISSTIERCALAQSPVAAMSLLQDLRTAVDSMITAVESYARGAALTEAVART